MTSIHLRERDRGHRRHVARAAVGLLLLASALLPGVPAVADAPKGLKVLGLLPGTLVKEGGEVHGGVVDVNESRGLLYYVWYHSEDMHYHLNRYSLRTKVPSLIADVHLAPHGQAPGQMQLSVYTPYVIVADRGRNRLLLLEYGYDATDITVVNLDTLKIETVWTLSLDLPGFNPSGMTYSAEDDRVYLIGEVAPNAAGLTDFFPTRPAKATLVAALEASTGKRAWVRPVTQCQQPMLTAGVGSLIARSARRPVLYFACARTFFYPGETGIVRLSITANSTGADAADFGVDFFGVSGGYTGGSGIQGIGSFDANAERFFLQSLTLGTPGTWVFDGTRSAWAGFIASPDNQNLAAGLNSGTGHYYMASFGHSSNPYLVVSDAAQLPVPQGSVFPFHSNKAFIATDPGSGRLFALMSLDKIGLGRFGVFGWVVLDDQTPSPPPPRPIDYDDLTVDTPEGPGTDATFAGSVNGYGVRATLVGGYGGAMSFTGGGNGAPLLPPLPGVAPGDRGIYLGRVAGADLRGVGATASAQGAAPDQLTSDELRERQSTVAATLPQAASLMNWPFPPATCADSLEHAQDKSQPSPGSDARVSCDLKATKVSALSEISVPAVFGRTSFKTDIRRDVGRGMVTRSTALVEGARLTIAGVGSLSIGRIEAIAETASHGRPGTAHGTWNRLLEGVSVVDEKGTAAYRCTSADSCDVSAIAEAVNDVFALRLSVDFPKPSSLATPRGAFAGVEKTAAQYLNDLIVNNDAGRAAPAMKITILNDSVDKSRLVIDLAGIQASSIYGISIMPGTSSDTPSGFRPDLPVKPADLPPTPDIGDPNVALPPPVASSVPTLVRSALILLRTPGQAALVGLLVALFGGLVATALRRRRLVRLLEGSPE